MSSNPSQKPPDAQAPPGRGSPSRSGAEDRIRQMIRDLDAPLDAVPANGDPRLDKRFKTARKAHDREVKRKQRDDLRRARDAARRVFKITPSISSRRAATAMLTAGAVGVAAFTTPKLTASHGIDPLSIQMTSDAMGQRVPAPLMRASARFKQALIEEEGVRYVVYRDVAGYPTVGVGHLIDAGDNLRVGDRISKEKVLDFLDGDLKEAEQGVRQLVGDLPLHQHEFDALVDLVYNVGLGNVSASESPRLNEAITARDYERIASELDYTHAAGRVARGLEFRSERRARIFLDAHYENPRASSGTDSV